jgi:peptide deformylase
MDQNNKPAAPRDVDKTHNLRDLLIDGPPLFDGDEPDEVLVWPHPWLRIKSLPMGEYYATDDAPVAFDELVPRLLKTMRQREAIGLSAILIGIPARVAVLEFSPTDKPEDRAHIALIDPEIKSMSKKLIEVEVGCLSLPGVTAKIKRPESIVVTTGRFGMPGRVALEAKGLVAANVLHQMDLMDGVLYWQRLSRQRQRSLLKQYERLVLDKMAGEAAPVLKQALSEV